MRDMRILAVVLALCACSGGGGDGSSTPPPTPSTPEPIDRAVSGLSPFAAGCGGAGGTLYTSAEVEPHLAVDPRDGNHLVAAWQQDRWSNGSSRGLLSGVSFDGGVTWTITQVPFSQCNGGNAQNGGDYVRASDPWVTFSPDGTAYQMGLVSTGGTFAAGSINAMTVSRSSDGGRTWSNPVALVSDTAPFFNDKGSITADPNDARFVYAVWDRLRQNTDGPAWFARTSNGGASWEAPRPIYDPGPNSQTISNLIRVLPDGTLVNLFLQLDGPQDAPTVATLRVIRSIDRGATWSAPSTISSQQSLGARDPTTGQIVRDGNIVPQMAVGPTGSLHVVWQDARFSGRDAIAYSQSADAGLTWTAPVRVNSNLGVVAFTPQVHVAADGTIGVAFFDFRSDTTSPVTLLTDYWLARSRDAVTWTESRISGPFDLLTAPNAGGLFLGDYMGLASAETTFLSLHARTTGSVANRTDIFLTRVAAQPAAAAAYSEDKLARAFETDDDFQRAVRENLARTLASRRTRWHQP